MITYSSYHWLASALLSTGVLHEKTGVPCQDANYWKILNDNILVAGVADGAGSAEQSEAIARNIETRDLDTTLILVVASPNIVVAEQVGDGAVVIEDDKDNIIGLITTSQREGR